MIHLNSKWAISFNELSVDVYEKRTHQKTGKEYTTPKYYYANLEQALEGIIDRSLVDDYNSIKEVVDKINAMKSDIREFYKQINQ